MPGRVYHKTPAPDEYPDIETLAAKLTPRVKGYSQEQMIEWLSLPMEDLLDVPTPEWTGSVHSRDGWPMFALHPRRDFRPVAPFLFGWFNQQLYPRPNRLLRGSGFTRFGTPTINPWYIRPRDNQRIPLDFRVRQDALYVAVTGRPVVEPLIVEGSADFEILTEEDT